MKIVGIFSKYEITINTSTPESRFLTPVFYHTTWSHKLYMSYIIFLPALEDSLSLFMPAENINESLMFANAAKISSASRCRLALGLGWDEGISSAGGDALSRWSAILLSQMVNTTLILSINNELI